MRSQEIGSSYVELTEEDRRILQRRVGIGFWCMYATDDAHDAEMMGRREQEKKTSTFSWEAWATHRREWFPSGWGQP